MSEQMPQEEPLTDGRELHRANDAQARVNRLGRMRGGDSSVMGEVVHKVCCQCGIDLHHRPRFKDSKARYWCPGCNEIDHQKSRPALCSDCGIEVPKEDLTASGSALLCAACIEKRRIDNQKVVAVMSRTAHVQHDGRDFPTGKLIFGLSCIVIAVVVWIWVMH